MNIGFDLDQTLLNFNKCESESLIEAFITHNILTGRDDERLEHLLNIYAHVSRHHWGQRGEKSVLEVMQLDLRQYVGEKKVKCKFDACPEKNGLGQGA